jgi:hypothetical protein
MLYWEPESARHAHYLHTEWTCILAEIDHKGFLDEYTDVLHRTDLIGAFQEGQLSEDDIVLLFSIDGA